MVGRGWKYTDSDMDWDVHWAERDWYVEYFVIVIVIVIVVAAAVVVLS